MRKNLMAGMVTTKPTLAQWATVLASTTVSSYVGQVATKTLISMIGDPFAATAEQNARMMHFATQDITSLKFVDANWYVGMTGDGGEHGSGGIMSITRSVEYPLATTRTPVLYSGIATGSIPDATTIVSDALSVSIPKGTKFASKLWTHTASGNLLRSTTYTTLGQSLVMTGEGWNNGVTTADLTQSATNPSAATTSITGPLAIIASTTKPATFVLGDSIGLGVEDTVDQTTGGMGCFGRALASAGIAYINGALGSQSAANWLVSHTLQLQLASYCTHVVCNLGYNDLVGAAHTPEQVRDDLIAVRALFAGKPFYQSTITPYTTGAWGSDGAQTNAAQTANINTLNGYIRSGATGATGWIGVREAVQSTTDANKWASPGGVASTLDGVHPNQAGSLLIGATSFVTTF